MPGFESIHRFESFVGQQKPIGLLTTLLEKGTVPHALLFTGIEGIGKQSAAMVFAMACNCLGPEPEHPFKGREKSRPVTTDPCGQCRSCRKIMSGSHPDIIIVEPSGPFIRIGQIRDLCQTLALKPFEAGLRVVIIKNCQALNPAAGNAFLKVLEEPPERTVLILTAGHTADLLPTIVSRCQHIRFNPISPKIITEMLIQKQAKPPDEAAIIAAMANGSFSKALAIAGVKKGIGLLNLRNWLIDQVDSLASKPLVFRLAFAARLAKDKDMLPESLAVIKSYLRDLVVYKYCPEKIMNQDLRSRIQNTSQQMTVASLLSKIKYIQTARKNILANANLRLTLEILVMRLAS